MGRLDPGGFPTASLPMRFPALGRRMEQKLGLLEAKGQPGEAGASSVHAVINERLLQQPALRSPAMQPSSQVLA